MSLTDQRAALEATVDERSADLSAARYRRDRQRNDATTELLGDLIANNNARPATPTESADFLKTAAKRGLLVEPIRTTQGWGVALSDPSVDEEFAAAHEAHQEARAALHAFDAEHGDDLAAERKAALAEELKDAIDSGDRERLNALLIEKDEDERTARERTADDLTSGKYEGWEDDTSRVEPTPASVPAADAALTSDELPG
jgi:hypothetical protein